MAAQEGGRFAVGKANLGKPAKVLAVSLESGLQILANLGEGLGLVEMLGGRQPASQGRYP